MVSRNRNLLETYNPGFGKEENRGSSMDKVFISIIYHDHQQFNSRACKSKSKTKSSNEIFTNPLQTELPNMILGESRAFPKQSKCTLKLHSGFLIHISATITLYEA